MDELLRQLMFQAYRLDVLKDMMPSELRRTQMLAAATAIEQIVIAIRRFADVRDGHS